MERNVTNLRMQSFLVEFSLFARIFLLHKVLFRVVLSHEIPQSFVASEGDSLELILIPQIREYRFNVVLIHAKLPNMQERTRFTDECTECNIGMSAFFLIAIYAELVIGIFLKQVFKQFTHALRLGELFHLN